MGKTITAAVLSVIFSVFTACVPAQGIPDTDSVISTVEKSSAGTKTEPEKESGTVADKCIALTFDDGPNTTTTAEVLDVLEKYGIKASFFLIGNNIDDASAKNVKRAYDMGCEINNHSKSHLYMNKLSAEEIKAEIDYVSKKVTEITGEAPKFFRPPFIAVSDEMFEAIDLPFIAGYGANDWEDKVTADKRAKAVLKQAKDGAIILLHDAKGNSQTVEALDTIIPELQKQGYEFVTLSELFERQGVKPEAHNKVIYSFAKQKTMYG